MPCGTKPVAKLVAGSCDQAPPSEPIGTRDMLSTPPATTMSSQPLATFCAARFTASRPDAQKRLICMPATLKSQPAFSAAVFAITEPCSPTGETTPITMSSSSAGSKPWRCCSLRSKPGEQVDRLDLVQAAVLLALAARRAHGVEDHRVGHLGSSLARRPERLVRIDKRLSGWAHCPTSPSKCLVESPCSCQP